MKSKYILFEIIAIFLVICAVIGIPILITEYHKVNINSRFSEKIINIVARNDTPKDQKGVWMVQKDIFWNYRDLNLPNEIIINQNEKITLLLTSIDAVHEFSIKDYNIVERVYPGKVTETTFIADKPGEFKFECTSYCGDGHEDMAGTLIVLSSELEIDTTEELVKLVKYEESENIEDGHEEAEHEEAGHEENEHEVVNHEEAEHEEDGHEEDGHEETGHEVVNQEESDPEENGHDEGGHAEHNHGKFEFEEYGLVKSEDGYKEYNIQLDRFKYSTEVIRVELGDRVRLNFDSLDVEHGVYLDGYGLKKTVPEKGFTTLEFIANKPGAFRFRCTSTCGPFHPFMISKLVVEPNYLFWGAIVCTIALSILVLLFLIIRKGGKRNEKRTSI